MNLLFFIFEVMGTIAFAISGAMIAIRHKMDLFGVAMLGLVTATGGGVIRDVIIGDIPPRVFRDSRYAMLAFGTALLVFIVLRFAKRLPAGRFSSVLDRLYFLSDTLGLAAFTVLGIRSVGGENGTLLLFVGVITGVGGGVLRDVFCGAVPSIFREHIYALASAAGAVCYILLLRTPLPEMASMLAGFGVVFIIRCLAAHYHWNLPKVEK